MKNFTLNLFFFIIPTTIVAQTSDDVKALMEDIFITRKYNKNIRPVINQTNTVVVKIDFYLNSIIEFDERTENLKTSGYLSLYWKDEHMSWSEDSFNGILNLFVPQDDIWKPDIMLRNSFTSMKEQGSSFLRAIVTRNGNVIWAPSQVFESTCSMSITYFPFDEQTCSLRFSAWSYGKTDVVLTVSDEGIQLPEYVKSATWDLVNTASGDVNNGDPEVFFKFTLRRKPRFYIITIIMPLILLSLLNTFSFVLPVTSGERAGYSITVFLSLAIFLTIISDQLPNNSENTSLLAVYIMLVTSLSTFIVLVCLIQLRMQSWYDNEQPVSRFVRHFVSFSNCLRCKRCKKQSIVPVNTELSEQKRNKGSDIVTNVSKTDLEEEAGQSMTTWLDVINAMDFIFFVLSIVYTFICTLVIGIIVVIYS